MNHGNVNKTTNTTLTDKMVSGSSTKTKIHIYI